MRHFNFIHHIKLVVIFISISLSNSLFGQWVNLNTGIDDDLSGIVFWGDNGIVSGSKGIYYTTNGGNGAANWSRFNIGSNQADSVLYNNTKFNHVYAYFDINTENNTAYACGKDTVNNQAVIMKFNLPLMTYAILYVGAPNSALNNIGYHGYGNADRYYAVGDNGLIVTFTNTSTIATNVVTSLTQKLTSMSFLANNVVIGAIEYRIYGTISNQIFTLTQLAQPGKEFLDVHKPFTSSQNAVGKNFYRSTASGNLITETNYDFGDLNGKSLVYKNSDYFVGTDHGIFKEVDDYYRLEWQPSSMNYTINEFWYVSANQSNFYACGNDGVVLFTTNNGGATKPYATISTSGACVANGSVYLYADSGSGTQCSWNINGSSAGSNCNSILYSTAVPGAFPVTMITSNGSFSDTAMTTLFIVSPPQFNLPYSVTDTILCNAEPLEITIENTEQNVIYSLYKYGTNQFLGSSPISNGGTLTFQTSIVTATGYYYIRAKSSFANCIRNFTDSIYILVEKTNADFHVGLINADVNEVTPFYEQTTEAQTFEWTFVNQNDTVYSTLADPSIPFSNLGSTVVTLKCWSGLGCSDSIQKMGPQIIDEASFNDSCWINIHTNNFSDGQLNWGYDPIGDLELTTDGYLISGLYEDVVFNSQLGDSISVSWAGGYLNKYSRNGALKWSVKCVEQPSFGGNQFSEIVRVVEDSYGNIICVGSYFPYIVDNGGDTTFFPAAYNNFILKFDANGLLIWHVTTPKFRGRELFIDNNNNIYIYGWPTESLPFGAVYGTYLNSVLQDSLFYDYMIGAPFPISRGIIKFSSQGVHEWSMPLTVSMGSQVEVRDINFDNLNNMYISGKYSSGMGLFEVTNTDITYFGATGTTNYTSGFITKYNNLGERTWFVSCQTNPSFSLGTHNIEKAIVDSAGNVYFAAKNGLQVPISNFWFFMNADSSTVSNSDPGYIVGKFNTNGILEWAHGLSVNLPVQNFNLAQAYELELTNQELSVAGIFSSLVQSTFRFRGNNNMVIDVPLNYDDYCIITYDTSGNILKALPSNDTIVPWSSQDSESIIGLYRDDDNSFYVARNDNFVGIAGYQLYEFGSELTITSSSGWVSKFKEECGSLYLPYYVVSTEQYICNGEDLILGSGQVITNVTQDTVIIENLVTATGIDSVVTLNVWVVPQMSIQTYENVCFGSSYTFDDGFTINQITNNASHTVQYTSVITGCDSLITYNLSVLPSDTIPISIDVCQDSIYIFPDGSSATVTSSPVSNYSTLISLNGCDSVILTTLYPVAINTDITVNNGVIQSLQTLGTFQWLDCDNGFAPIVGETLSSFAPLIDGNYAVALTYNGCLEYSDCESITGLAVGNLPTLEGINLFPNPTTGEVTIELDTEIKATSIRLVNLAGSILPMQNDQILDQKIHLNLPFDSGVYFIELINANHVIHRLKVVKN